jgi:hypothetical protein
MGVLIAKCSPQNGAVEEITEMKKYLKLNLFHHTP